MWLDGKVSIRSLHIVPFSDAPDLVGHALLFIAAAYMLDNGVRKNKIEFTIAKFRHTSGIPGYAADVGARRLCWLDVQQRDFDVRAPNEAERFPSPLQT